MQRKNDVPTRNEVTETVEKHENDISEKVDEMDVIAKDAEIVRETLDNLDFEGTAEGTDEVESSIQRADDVAVERFEEEDEHLEEIQDETEEYEGELQERSDISESDLGKISDASGQIDTQESVNELVDAKEGVLRDIEFLDEHIEQANEAREESDHEQEKLQNRIRSERK